MNKKVLLTGDRPTGPLHIGHLFGSLLSRKELESEYESYVMVADIQALTDNFEHPDKIRENVYEITADNLAIGLNPEKTTFFIQSQIPHIAELTVFYSNLVTINTLKRNPTVKAEVAQKTELFGKEGESLTYGFLGYPVSQAADITIVRASIVPVGEEQLPMIEQTREIVEKFHRVYKCAIFPIPQGKLSKGSRIMGLDGNAKMSKSLNNAIYLKDSPEETIVKIKTAKTDSESTVGFDPKKRPEISNLVLIFSLIYNIDPKEAVKELGKINYSAFKLKLAEDLNNYLAPIREKRKDLKPEYIREVLESGRKKVLIKAEETMSLVRKAMKIDY
ncbi:MAG: tryptophan--tRNA ligase [Candidatus Yanofskybacteria bacterium RIFCSPHIGHO2_02_FULL_41_29]|uniref:Tryptophan--tRNA ligase n=1 Tax=Candidatus Yanofskybacteria bacterium RIFCSPHIGHO2_01_FULL_41_53 TaxID=1802663 RepID=A0A1F8EMB1_9BACT|nr:MAG: tryptophan--tRNA ligase [Candidatus Yanofskybacteria bacterium RIFCSPHIGHO2_01_FULL_41_53]OGN10385.1 MAG: tryptophan--tRNA ligase [Candidatus Yanofskybacteria bacterium RIFCSPHIGHO2_02_FULL_41_29]OGN17368.1 MAG: tryptophan--tRNA ligase [Candidatus Yanofskybacteria bacterium RIFCSPHIGHO2_12_FULL_41_9]OGN21330.1 MAG: tryptophan--tRNA ligase [Candidatus Yanofskybacteria bacterium RIFCSPLOWO2_01_FULL_41_67]OGN29100.1 MAG: tryptophan--tRNA ligase [Candidatus Yanofskybacteria bacterium RIFCSP